LFKILIILKFNLGIAAIGSHIIKTVKKSIFVISLADSFSNLVLSTLSILFLVVSLQALKIAFNSSFLLS
jgi:hypothetical protein